MVGIIIASHGEMAKGVLETTKLFFGEQEQLEALCLNAQDNPDEFVGVIEEAIKRVDTGDGVIIFCDLLFGSPCNCSARIMKEGVDVVTGVNLPMLLELLGSRSMGPVDLPALLEIGRTGIANLPARRSGSWRGCK